MVSHDSDERGPSAPHHTVQCVYNPASRPLQIGNKFADVFSRRVKRTFESDREDDEDTGTLVQLLTNICHGGLSKSTFTTLILPLWRPYFSIMAA